MERSTVFCQELSHESYMVEWFVPLIVIGSWSKYLLLTKTARFMTIKVGSCYIVEGKS